MAQIAILGTGYVGLTTGACFSSIGHQVVCADIDRAKIFSLQGGHLPIVEDGLQELLDDGLRDETLSFTDDLASSVGSAEFVFICVPTPQGEDGRADLSYVEDVVSKISHVLRPGSIVVNKSTVPVGTAQAIKRSLGRDDVDVVSNPEFLRQGSAVFDFLHPSRIVVGGSDDAAKRVAAIYGRVEAPILKMSSESAETLKYAANSFLATKLTFINAVADLCEAVGADIFEVANGIGLDPRIGSEMLRAGPGWGGSCFPKDTRALVSIAANVGYDFALLRGVIETNDRHYQRIARKAIELCGGQVDGLTIGAWGLTFKAGTDDLRDSPAIKILSYLNDAGAVIQAYDPTARAPYRDLPWIEVAPSALAACSGADVLVVLTEWQEFEEIAAVEAASVMKFKRVVDGRNLLDRQMWREAGFDYRGVGR